MKYFSLSSNVRKLITPPHSQIRLIDGLRALSILWVVAFHTAFITGLYVSKERYETLLSSKILRPIWTGTYGGDIFFAMSGFLIGRMLITVFTHRRQPSILSPADHAD